MRNMTSAAIIISSRSSRAASATDLRGTCYPLNPQKDRMLNSPLVMANLTSPRGS
jgi:hypothetical protein